MVDRRASIDAIRAASAKYGTITLRDSCSQLVWEEITTTDEMLKVI